jgi:gliding motility-associated-like protein
MDVTINNPLTPTLTIPANQCNTVATVNFTGSPPGGTWTPNGNLAVSPAGILTPGLANIGINSVTYSVAAGNCIVANTGTYSVSQFNTAALTGSLSLRCVQDGPSNLMNLVQSTLTGQWSAPGGGAYVSNNLFYPAGLASGTYSLLYSTQSTTTTSNPSSTTNVCPHSTVLLVQVFNPPTPTITPIAQLCNNAPTVALSAQPTAGGIWSGNQAISSTGILTPSVSPIGANTVTYTSGTGTCVASSSVTFQVSRYNTPALTGSIANLCVKSLPVNLTAIVQSTAGGTWTGINVAPGASAGSYSFSPQGLPTGTYVLTYSTASFPNPSLCPDSTKITVSVLNPPPPNIASAGPLCSVGNTVQLSVNPPNSGTWTAYPYITPSGVLIPSLCAVGGNPVQYVTGTSTCSAQHTRTISVEAFVPATINNSVPDQCNTSPAVNLLPITLSSGGIWTGNGILGSIFNPGVSGAGTHVLTYNTASSPSGLCPDQATVAVRVFSLATPVVSKAGPFCNISSPVKLLVNPVGGYFAGANNGAVTLQGLFNPALGVIGDNIVSYSVSSGPCVAFVQTTISVERFISADPASSNPVMFCQGDDPVNMDQFVVNPGGLWIGPGISGSRFDPKKANLGSNNIAIYQTHSDKNALLCPDTAAIRITVSPTPTIELSSPKTEGCTPLELLFEVKPQGGMVGGKASWYIGDGAEPVSGLTISHTFTLPGTYTLLTNYASENGCTTQATLKTPINVYQAPAANFDFEPKDISVSNPEVSFINLSSSLNSNKYQWSFKGLGSSSEVNPKMSFLNAGVYRVTLTATSYNGCTSQITKNLEVANDFNVFIPSSFSPNADGLNDVFIPVFSPYGLDSKSFQMDIFDRWGHLLFHSADPTKGWDGSLNNKNDSPLKQDTYIYKVQFKDLDGRIYQKVGTVSMLSH